MNSEIQIDTPKMSRRSFINKGLLGGAGIATAGILGESYQNSFDLKVTKHDIAIKDLPDEFDGFRIVHITDPHNSIYMKFSYLEHAFEIAQKLAPDLFVLTGDYVTARVRDIPPVMKLIGALKAPCGKVGVLGNHDHWTDEKVVRKYLHKSGVEELTNKNTIIRRNGAGICMAGVADFWNERTDNKAAFAGVPAGMPRIFLVHNPDYVECMPGEFRIDLTLSGHTHGGQVVLPVIGAPFPNSRYGQKYLSGMVQAPHCRVYVSRGIGFVRVGRINCPPEIPVFTLRKDI
jgi:uncharacterized protein